MPGEADRLKKENEELRKTIDLLGSYNKDLERRLKRAEGELTNRDRELEKRMDQVAAAYDAWDLMRDNQAAKVDSMEQKLREHLAPKRRRLLRKRDL